MAAVQPVRRNMRHIQPAKRGDQDIPVRTTDKKSPMKQSAGSKHPSENHTRDVVDGQINHELTKARYRSLDLADLMFGHLVTTRLARDILERFLADGTVTCEEIKPNEEEETRHALNAAHADTVAHACIRSDAPIDEPASDPATKYQWSWPKFPTTPINENKLVAFLNSVADSALLSARSILQDDSLQPRNRFAAPVDKNHAIPLSYEPDGEDMRPDFMVLPLAAFSDDEEPKVKEAYVNFTAMLLAGESKSARNAREGLIQVQRYMRGIKRAQPWLRFATGMTVGKDFVSLLRGDCSGLERVELSLTDGRGCIEFIRIILGIVLAGKRAFGHNPEVEIEEKDVSVDVPELRSETTPRTGSYSMMSGSASQSAISPILSGPTSKLGTCCSASSDPPHVDRLSATSSAGSKSSTASAGSKRDLEDEVSRGPKSKRRKRTVALRAFIPVRVYGRHCIGILFTSGSIRGRGTTVYVVVGAGDGKTYLALKTSWQDVARAEDQAAVLKKLSDHKPHPNVITPSRLFDPMAKDCRVDSTLGSIRAFLDDEMQRLGVENRILTVTISELRRPVAYFWSPHDFVRGVIGALLGILHRDISENNIVLAPFCDKLGDELGALIDFDMAIVGPPNMQENSKSPPKKQSAEELLSFVRTSSSPLPVNDQPYKAQRTGTTPYMSIDVLRGEPHTHFDDIESFLYVLVLFFFSYKGPLEEQALRRARVRGFIQAVGEGRLPHVTAWPARFERWASGTLEEISNQKAGDLSPATHRAFMRNCYPLLRERWAHHSPDSPIPYAIAVLIAECWTMFAFQERQVTHSQFIKVLREWLKKYEGDERNYVNPFDN
ncbi:hypothetical protein EDD16DRAFT_1523100 [Pisolithus croceorrhizus]|nr:hypothetical protein EDD16DRAFT_1523100 [Pisolithus croceorrhizus]KAI6124115.1 hypothetical protein EV401DRAFT_1886507 [Pisolithus croceorrhizus]